MNYLKEYLESLLEEKPVGSKNKSLWLDYLKEKYSENNEDVYITFVSEDKVGINPKSRYNTPIGVCTYPVKWTLEYTKKYNLPFMSTNPKKMKILKKTSDKVLDRKFTEEQFQKILVDNYKFFKREIGVYQGGFTTDEFLEYLKLLGPASIVDSPFGKLMKLTRDSVDKNPKKWTALLIKLGFDIIEDSGQGIIHESEPTQTIFLAPSSYKVIDETYVNTTKRYEDTNKSGGIDSIIQDLSNASMTKPDNMISFLKYHSSKILQNKFEQKEELKRFCNAVIRSLIRDNEIEQDKIDFVFKLFKPIFIKFVHSFDINSYGFLENIRNRTNKVLTFLKAYDKIDPGYIENKLYNSLTPNQYSMEMFNYIDEDYILDPEKGYYKNIIKKLIDNEYVIIFDEFPTSLLKKIVERYHKQLLEIYKKEIDEFPKSVIKFLKTDLKESFKISPEKVDDYYETFKKSYDSSTGHSWSKDKFIQRAANWIFFGDSSGFVTVRKQNSGYYKITGSAGNPKSILKGLDELISENKPTWTAATENIANMLKKKGFIVAKGFLYYPFIKLLIESIPSYVFGDSIEEVKGNSAVVFNIDGHLHEKYFCCNKQYLKELLSSDQIPDKLKAIINKIL